MNQPMKKLQANWHARLRARCFSLFLGEWYEKERARDARFRVAFAGENDVFAVEKE